MIFTQQQRTDWTIKIYGDTSFSFLNKCAWPIANFARSFINNWGTYWENDNDFRGKICSKSDKQHDAAVFELLLFAILKQAGLNIHPNPVEYGKKTPDFFIDYQNANPIFVECTLAENAMETYAEREKKESVMLYIEQMKNFDFWVNIKFNCLSNRSILKKPLKAFLIKLANEYRHIQPGHRIPMVFRYQSEGWDLEIDMIRKNSAIVRSRGITSQPVKIIDNFKPLYTALQDKRSSKYNLGNHPYVIALAVDDMTVHDFELSEALFGANDPNRIYMGFKGTGYFRQNEEPWNTGVSAVLFCNHMKLFGLTATEATLWHNPFCRYPLEVGTFPFDEYYYTQESDVLLRHRLQKNFDLFNNLNIDRELYEQWYSQKQKPN